MRVGGCDCGLQLTSRLPIEAIGASGADADLVARGLKNDVVLISY